MSDKGHTNNNSIKVFSEMSELLNIREFVRDKALSFGFGEDDAFSISLAVDEACANLIRYAYNFRKDKIIRINVELLSNQFIVNIEDTGAPFNPLEVPEADMDEYFRKFKRGGLGIQIMRKVMDEIAYIPSDSINSHNILKLKKHLR